MFDILLRALLGGLGVAAVAGPLGAFVVWRRMAYFGDTLAHSALLGVALGFLFDVNLNLAIIVLCVGLAAVLVVLQKKHIIATDTLLGILAHSALSLGLVAVSFLDNIRIDLMAYLFGDLLAISPEDLYWIYAGGLAVISLLVIFWKPLLAMTVNEELAKVEGYPVEFIRLLLMLLVALVIAVAMKIVGVLLITSLMIIPAATARKLSRTPIQMASMASIIGCLAVLLSVVACGHLINGIHPQDQVWWCVLPFCSWWLIPCPLLVHAKPYHEITKAKRFIVDIVVQLLGLNRLWTSNELMVWNQ